MLSNILKRPIILDYRVPPPPIPPHQELKLLMDDLETLGLTSTEYPLPLELELLMVPPTPLNWNFSLSIYKLWV